MEKEINKKNTKRILYHLIMKLTRIKFFWGKISKKKKKQLCFNLKWASWEIRGIKNEKWKECKGMENHDYMT